MNTKKNIFIAFILNFLFSIFEFIGGILTGSIAILSDSLHDLIDSISIGSSYFLEKKSTKKPDLKYTYGYSRYSVISALFISMMLIISSSIFFTNSIERLIYIKTIDYNGMIIFAIIGFLVNLIASFVTKGGHSSNQKAVNLHMLEDVFGWFIVLIGAIIMKFTNLKIIDPILSILLSIIIMFSASKNIFNIMPILLLKTPNNIDINNLKNEILKIDSIVDVHHIHICSINEDTISLTMHIITNGNHGIIKKEVKHYLHHLNINHITLEIEDEEENCIFKECNISHSTNHHHHHHH